MNKNDEITSWKKQTKHVDYPDPRQVPAEVSAENIEKWLIAWLSKKLKISPQDIDKNKSVLSLGLDSIGAVELEREVQNKFDVEISLVDFLENNSINDLVEISLKKYKQSA